jgi:hypothetical protein
VPAQTVATPAVGESRIAAPADALLPWGAGATVRRESIVPGAMFAVPATRGSACWVEVIGGELAYRGQFLRAGDGLGVADEPGFALVSSYGADLLVVELPA